METNTASATAVQSATVVLDLWPSGLLMAAAAFLCAMAIQRIAGGFALRPLRRSMSGHWTERARLAYPGWSTLASGQIFQPFIWAVITKFGAARCDPGVVAMVAISAFAGAGLTSIALESRVRERAVSVAEWCRAWSVQILFFLASYVIFFLLISQLPAKSSWASAGMILVSIGVVLALSFGGVIALARCLGLLRPASDRLRAIVKVASERMGVPPPVSYVLRWHVVNAVAFPLSRAIAVTDTALNSLGDDELAAICAHELAHLDEPRNIRLARLAGQLAWLPLLLVGPLGEQLGSMAGSLTAYGLFLISFLLSRRLTLKMELRADLAGKAHEGEAGTYARALEKLHEINLMPAVTWHGMPTHPHLYDRLLAAGITPDYPRPDRPSSWRSKIAMAFILVATVFCALMAMGLLTHR